MDVEQLLSQVSDSAKVSRVFGEPVREGDVLLVPVARVRGGGGGGSGTGPDTEGSGSGGGGGFTADPAGVYVVKDGEVTWRPAVDVNRVVVGGQLVLIVMFLVLRSVLRRRS
jgi:uncharacterized spore protein YtfJ